MYVTLDYGLLGSNTYVYWNENDGADIALDSTPVTLVLCSNRNENSILNVQKAVFVTEDELNRVNGDVVPKIMPTNSEGVE